MASEQALPLDDLTVVELGESIAAAWGGKLLADFGANVIRIDALDDGELFRTYPLVGADRDGLPVSAAYLYLNQNKKSIGLDLDQEQGKAVLGDLIARADVVIDGLGVDKLAGLGFSHDSLLEQHPDLFIAAVTPYGLSGPYRDLQSSELTVLALGGLLHMVGFTEREPLKLGGSQAEYAAGLSVFSAVMTGITYRDQGGTGQVADISLLETVAFMEWKSGSYYEADGRVRYRTGDRTQWQVLAANDGYVGLVYQDASWPALKELVGDPRLEDEKYLTRAGRTEHALELREIFEPWFRERSKHDIYRDGQAKGIPLGFVATIEDLLESEQYAARGFWHDVTHPVHGTAKYPGDSFQITGVTPKRERAPLPGENTADVLKDLLKRTEEEINQLRLGQVI
jgi:crotonobetainyl-CoA:carnitine CoA-transferase CaiB-like acyl-CoA transferase